MGVIDRLWDFGYRRPSMLLVAVPGATDVRWRVEQEARSRGWTCVDAPAHADVLVVCGRGDETFTTAVGGVWDELPGPRARCDVLDADKAGPALDGAGRELLDRAARQREERGRPGALDIAPLEGGKIGLGMAGMAMAGTGAPETSLPEGDPRRTDPPGGTVLGSGMTETVAAAGMRGTPVPGDGAPKACVAMTGPTPETPTTGTDMPGMDMGGMDMPMPGGLPEAVREDDRDGLKLDVLHVQLGPVLAHWPAGLVMSASMQGDVLQATNFMLSANTAQSRRDPAAAEPLATPVSRGHLDQLRALLVLAGDERRARLVTKLRDDPSRASQVGLFAARLRRARMLRRSLRGVGVLHADTCAAHGFRSPLAPAGSDAEQRMLLLADAARDGAPPGPVPSPGLLADAVTGLELTEARLTVASLCPADVAWAAAGASQTWQAAGG